MCLYILYDRKPYPDLTTTGYKVMFKKDDDELYGIYQEPASGRSIGVKYKADTDKCIANNRFWYKSGFHVYVELSDAKDIAESLRGWQYLTSLEKDMDIIVVEVEVTGRLAFGQEIFGKESMDVFVWEYMTIVKEVEV